MEKVQHGNSRSVARTPKTSKKERFTIILTALLIIVAKLFILDVYGGPGYTSGNSTT